jgi:hypothetical protein
MSRISGWLCAGWLALLGLAAAPTAAEVASTVSAGPVYERISSGLVTFSTEDRLIRVAIAFVQRDDATVPTVVRFVDARGTVLKTRSADLRANQPVVVELTRQDIGEQPDLLVRAEALLNFPEPRPAGYPVVTTMQLIAREGFARLLLSWYGGVCPTGSHIPFGTSASCPESLPDDFASTAR